MKWNSAEQVSLRSAEWIKSLQGKAVNYHIKAHNNRQREVLPHASHPFYCTSHHSSVAYCATFWKLYNQVEPYACMQSHGKWHEKSVYLAQRTP